MPCHRTDTDTPGVARPMQRGFTYLTIIFILAMFGGGLALTGEVWHTAVQREKEIELIFIGGEYRKAIERYFLAGQRQYPRSLDDLLQDPRRPTIERYLRKHYPDPITGKPDWGIVKAADGGIMGVHSLSDDKPYNTVRFRPPNKESADDTKYSDWIFVYTPPQPAVTGKPATKPPAAPRP